VRGTHATAREIRLRRKRAAMVERRPRIVAAFYLIVLTSDSWKKMLDEYGEEGKGIIFCYHVYPSSGTITSLSVTWVNPKRYSHALLACLTRGRLTQPVHSHRDMHYTLHIVLKLRLHIKSSALTDMLSSAISKTASSSFLWTSAKSVLSMHSERRRVYGESFSR